MRDNPSNVPTGGPLRPVVGVLALVVVVALVALLIPGGPLGIGGRPTEVVVTASEDDRLVDAARVHAVSDLEPGSPVGRAALRAHSRDATVIVNGTVEEIEVVHLGDGDREVTWVRVNGTQYRVTVERDGP